MGSVMDSTRFYAGDETVSRLRKTSIEGELRFVYIDMVNKPKLTYYPPGVF